MANSDSRPRFFRLQFSLRAILALMVLVGVGLIIYRWPWQVEEKIPRQTLGYTQGFNEALWFRSEFWVPAHAEVSIAVTSGYTTEQLRAVSTYCRGWNGKPVKHGLERVYTLEREEVRLLAEQQFRDGERVHVVWHSTDGDYIADSCRQDKRHGKCGARFGPFTWEGMCVDSLKQGPWLCTFRDGTATTVGELNFVDNRAQGVWKWTAGGQVLQTAQFEDGELVAWNGRPLSEALEQWFDDQQADHCPREILSTRIGLLQQQNLWAYSSTSLPSSTKLQFDAGTLSRVLKNHREPLLVRAGRTERDYELLEDLLFGNDSDQPLGEVLVHSGLLCSRLIVLRYGLVTVVPICERELAWRDSTGVLEIQFPAGSPQAEAWQQRIDEQATNAGEDHRRRLEQLFADTAIEIDASAIVDTAPFSSRSLLPSHLRARRDVLGLILAEQGWSCELRGTKLVIQPHPAGAKNGQRNH